MKNSYIIILCAFLLIGQRAWGESVTKTVHFSHSELKCDTITGGDGQVYSILSYPQLDREEKKGYPLLPVKYISVTLPYTADDISLGIKQSNVTIHALNKKLFPVQEPEHTILEKVEEKFISCDKSIYESASSYPSKPARITEISCAGHGDRYVVIAIYPAVYSPIENQYDFCEDIELTISYNHSSQRAQILARGSQTVDIGIPFYEYCVITSQNLKNAFSRLVAWKRQKGLNAGIVCVEDILNNNNIVGDVVSTIYDDAGKIRQYLQYAYASGTTKYVLFGGNNQVLPIRYGTKEDKPSYIETIPEYDHIPTDLYFSELNSNWRYDNDYHYGEPCDLLDYGSELAVGRLLCTTSEDVQNYTDKLFRYEMNPGNGYTDYLKRAFYVQGTEWKGMHQADSLAKNIMDIFPDTVRYEEKPDNDTHPTWPSGDDVITAMRSHFGYLNWLCHGTPYSFTVRFIQRQLRCAVKSIYGIAIPASAIDTDHPDFEPESFNGLDKLNNKLYPMIAYSSSCFCCPFDTYSDFTEHPNIAQSFTMGKDYGGPAIIGNTRESSLLNAFRLQKRFDPKMKTMSIGDALVKAKQEYNDGDKHWMNLSTNLIGCPELKIWTDTLRSFNATLEEEDGTLFLYLNNPNVNYANIHFRDITSSPESLAMESKYANYGGRVNTQNDFLNNLVTITESNVRPQILPLYLQDTELQGTHYLITKDVYCGSDVTEASYGYTDDGSVTFISGSDYTFEKNGKMIFTKNVKIEQGAKLKIVNSNIVY